jgi:hypothetical protein
LDSIIKIFFIKIVKKIIGKKILIIFYKNTRI